MSHASYLFVPEGPEPEIRTTVELLMARLKPRLFYDVGANFGYYSLLFVADGDRCALALEPDPRNVSLLLANAARIPSGKVRVVAAAASDTPGLVPLVIDYDTGHRSTVEHTYLSAPSQLLVPNVTLNNIAQDLGPPDLVKIDVEGHEYKVLQGAGQALAGLPPLVIECFHGLDGPCVALMKEMGYVLLDAETRAGPVDETSNFLAVGADTQDEISDLLDQCDRDPGRISTARSHR